MAGQGAVRRSADQGQGLLSTGTQRVAFHSVASPVEHELITTNPAELTEELDDAEAAYVDIDDIEAAQ